MKKYKMCIIDQSNFLNNPIGGITSFVRTIVPQLSKFYEVTLFGGTCISNQLNKINKNYMPDIDFYGFKDNSKIFGIIPNRLISLYYLYKSSKLIKEMKFDYLYFHYPEMLLPFINDKKTKKILHLHGMYNPLFGSRFKFLRKKIFMNIYDLLFQYIQKNTDLILTVSAPTKNKNELKITNLKKLKYVPVTVDPSLFFPKDYCSSKKNKGLYPDKTIFGYVGRISKKKGIDHSLNILTKANFGNGEYQYIIVGDGEYKTQILNIIANNNLTNNVICFPAQNYELLLDFYNAIDIFLLTSEAEGFPMVILEALSCGKPVLSFDVGQISNIIKDGYNGFILKSKDHKIFIEKSAEIMNDYTHYSQNAFNSASKFYPFNIAKTIDKLIKENN